jgi:cell division protein FtsA
MARRNIVVGLDIGTTKITALVGEVGTNGQVYIIGVGETPSRGLRKGAIVNIDETVRSIDLAIEKAERMSGVEINDVFVGVAGPNISSINNQGVIAITGPNREILVDDVQRVLRNVRMVGLPAERKIIHVIPRQFIVDGYDGVRDPVGMAGVRLEVEAHIITGSTTYLQNVHKIIQSTGLKLLNLMVSPIAAAEAVLYSSEKQLGSILVDIGGGTTDVTLYDGGSPWLTFALPIGGDHITCDLAVGLRTTLVEAERIKQENGCVLVQLAPDHELISAAAVGGNGVNQVSRKKIAGIIQPRVQEIFALIREEVEKSGYRGILPGGCVLTGGSVLIDGIAELTQEELQLPVRQLLKLARPVS